MRFILGFLAGAAVYCWLDKTEEKKPADPAQPGGKSDEPLDLTPPPGL